MGNTTTDRKLPGEYDATEIVDLRDLEAPEPMVRILEAGVQLGPQDHCIAHLPHVPHPLFPHLETRGLGWQVFDQRDGSALIVIRRASCKPPA